MTPLHEDEKLLLKIMVTAVFCFIVFVSVIGLAICGLISIINPCFFA